MADSVAGCRPTAKLIKPEVPPRLAADKATQPRVFGLVLDSTKVSMPDIHRMNRR